jgi:hypothetical protein
MKDKFVQFSRNVKAIKQFSNYSLLRYPIGHTPYIETPEMFKNDLLFFLNTGSTGKSFSSGVLTLAFSDSNLFNHFMIAASFVHKIGSYKKQKGSTCRVLPFWLYGTIISIREKVPKRDYYRSTGIFSFPFPRFN